MFQTGGFPDLDLSFLFCPFLSFWDFPGDFPDLSRGLSGDFPDWSFSSFSAYYQHLRGTVPKGSATQSGPFPKKVGNTRVWKHPGLASLKGGGTVINTAPMVDSLQPPPLLEPAWAPVQVRQSLVGM